MKRSEKTKLVDELHATFGEATSVVLTHQVGLTVSESNAIRQKMRQAGARYKVTKNRIAKIALHGTKFEALSDQFTGPTAIGTSSDPVAAAKTLVAFAKDNDKLSVIGGAIDGRLLDKAGVEALARLPSLDALRSKIVGILQAPATQLARVTQAPASKLARVIQARADQLQS